jgi:hypothetical protein
MKIAAVQILFYVIDRTSDPHTVAASWREDAINTCEPMGLGLAWPTVHEFLRLGTNPAFAGAMAHDKAPDGIGNRSMPGRR